MRALYEGAQADFGRLAQVSGKAETTIRKRADAEGWSSPTDDTGPLDHGARVAALAEKLMDEMEAIEREGHATGYDKARIDAVTALTRALEKLGEFTQSGHNRKEAAIKNDAELAAILKRIDERIVELATEYARELVARSPDAA